MRKAIITGMILGVTLGPALGQSARSASVNAPIFQQIAIGADAFEIESSRLALHKSTSPRVQQFAQRMIQDHTMTTASLTGQGGGLSGPAAGAASQGAAAGPVGAVVGGAVGTVGAAGGAVFGGAAPLDARHSAMLAQLAAANGPQFDQLYKRMQIQAHREALALYSRFAARGDNPVMAQFARRTLPHLRTHLAMAQRM
jgi:putative membrane protein